MIVAPHFPRDCRADNAGRNVEESGSKYCKSLSVIKFFLYIADSEIIFSCQQQDWAKPLIFSWYVTLSVSILLNPIRTPFLLYFLVLIGCPS